MSYDAVNAHSQVDLNSSYANQNAGYGANRQTPYGSGDPYYSASTGYIAQGGVKSRSGTSKWVKFGIPLGLLVVVGVVVGVVLGTRAHNNSSSSSSSSSASSNSASGKPASASEAVSAKNALGRFASATDYQWMLPLYPSTTNAAAFSAPTYNAKAPTSWPTDTFAPTSPSVTAVRSDRPRLIGNAYKWAALPDLIASDPYLKGWNETIMGNATQYASLPLVPYFLDGGATGNGLLDAARAFKQRMKVYSYAYRITNDTKWADHAYAEIQNTASDAWGPNNATKWNPVHFLDTAEMMAAYAVAYDWLHEVFTDDQKTTMRNNLITYGLNLGLNIYTQGDKDYYGWWTSVTTKGNWNCVCNNGLTMAALAILGDDTTGTAETILANTVPNALQACSLAPTPDGTWAETNDYWYFGSTGFAEMTSSLLSATGSTYGMETQSQGYNLTGYFHMYAQGATSLFNWGDNGPNKFSATANALLFYGDLFNNPVFQLYQRDQWDAADPWSMFWYNPAVTGAFWDGLPLDRYFENSTDQWASMRSSWTDQNALFVAIKAGTNLDHQTHNDLDVGDFVIDALGTRWAGELGDGDYLSTGYFSTDAQDSQRWLYYRKRTEGQNTILVGGLNQNVNATPTASFGSTGEAQGSSTVYTVPDKSAAYFTADLSSAYFNSTQFKRGIRTINARKQVLLQDEITSTLNFEWRMHTNATVTLDSAATTATLTLDGQTMQVKLLSPASGAQWSTQKAVRLDSDPALPPNETDQPNDGVTVLTIALGAGTYTLEVLFNPQWSGMSASDFVTPPSVALDSWSTTSHN